jgi:hypothetical protein
MKLKEFITVAAVVLAILFFNNLPLLVGYWGEKQDLKFLGRRLINSQDTYTYIAFIEQAKQGKTLFENLYTTDHQEPRLLRPSYLFIGKFAAISGMSSIGAYHFFRIILGFIFGIILYKFIGVFFSKHRLAVLVFILTSSGLGFLLGSLFKDSIDLWVPEAITFMSLAEAPHFILSQILMVFVFWSFLKKRYFLSGLSLLLLSFEHPFDLFPILFTLVIILLWERKISLSMIWIFLFAGIGGAYQLFELTSNPVLKAWSSQNVLLSPDPISYFIGFGLLIPLAVIGGEKFLEETTLEKKLIIVWFAAGLILPFFPVSFQRRFIEGAHIPLAILAIEGIFFLSKKYGKLSESVLIGIMILSLSFSSIALVLNDFREINKDTPAGYYYYLLDNEITAMNWLKANSQAPDGVLSNWFYGNLIPGLTGRRVYLGHKIQTPNFDERIEKINKFILNTNGQEALKFLEDNNIDYIFLGKNDSIIAYGFEPNEKPYLIRVYDHAGVTIYKVK